MTGKQRRRLAVLTHAALQDTMFSIARDPVALNRVVADGPFLWRQRFLKTFHGLLVDGTIADRLYAFFDQVQKRDYTLPAGQVLDSVTESSPPTQHDIDNGWEVESLSSEAGRRHLYGPDGHPEELIKKLVEH